MDWQPIETAPKDGTVIDLWVKTWYGRESRWLQYRIADAHWGSEDGYDIPTGYVGWVSDQLHCDELWPREVEEIPTHWMHRPAPPEAA